MNDPYLIRIDAQFFPEFDPEKDLVVMHKWQDHTARTCSGRTVGVHEYNLNKKVKLTKDTKRALAPAS
jgi:hypothetical protein